MGNYEECLYYHLGTCLEAEEGCEADCFEPYYEDGEE